MLYFCFACLLFFCAIVIPSFTSTFIIISTLKCYHFCFKESDVLRREKQYSFIFTRLPCFVLFIPFYRSKFPHGFISLQPEAFSFSYNTILLAKYSVTFHLSENVFIPPSFFKKIQYIENTEQRHLLFLSHSRCHLVSVVLFFVIVFWFPLFLIGSPAIICSTILLCNVTSFSGCFQDYSFIFGFQQFDHDVPRYGFFVFILLGDH